MHQREYQRTDDDCSAGAQPFFQSPIKQPAEQNLFRNRRNQNHGQYGSQRIICECVSDERNNFLNCEIPIQQPRDPFRTQPAQDRSSNQPKQRQPNCFAVPNRNGQVNGSPQGCRGNAVAAATITGIPASVTLNKGFSEMFTMDSSARQTMSAN